MKLKQIIVPEQILGKRGHPRMLQALKDIIGGLKKVPKGDKWGYSYPQHLHKLVMNENLLRFYVAAKLWKDQNGKIYYVGKDFARALSNVDRDIPVSVLPSKLACYVQFAKGALFDESGEVDGAFLAIGTQEDTGVSPSDASSLDRVLVISYGVNNKDDQFGPEQVACLSCEFTQARIDDLASKVPNRDYYGTHMTEPSANSSELRSKVYRAVMNAVIYAYSADPEIMKLRPLEEFSNSKRSELKKQLPVHNELTLPVQLLYWNYHEPVHYNVDETTVRAHMRWQRCGPGLMSVKLILIDEHRRHYRKDNEWTTSSAPSVSQPAPT